MLWPSHSAVGFEKRTERAAGLALGAFSCPGRRNSCRRWAAIDDRSAQHWTAHVLADAKNGRRPVSDSGISDNTWIPGQKMESITADVGPMRRPPKSKVPSWFFFPNQVRHDRRGHRQSLNKPTIFRCYAGRNPNLRRTPRANALRPTRATSRVGRAKRRLPHLPFL